MIKLPIDSQYKGLKLNKSKKNSKNSFRIDVYIYLLYSLISLIL